LEVVERLVEVTRVEPELDHQIAHVFASGLEIEEPLVGRERALRRFVVLGRIGAGRELEEAGVGAVDEDLRQLRIQLLRLVVLLDGGLVLARAIEIVAFLDELARLDVLASGTDGEKHQNRRHTDDTRGALRTHDSRHYSNRSLLVKGKLSARCKNARPP